MKKQNQNGSALIVVAIIIVVAILAALGFVFWKDLTKKPTSSSTKTTSQTTTATPVAMKTVRVNSSFPSPLSWSYPANWSITNSTQGTIAAGDTGEQTFIMTSPSGNYKVTYLVGIGGGRGGTCQADEAGTLQYIREESISGFSGGKFVEYIDSVYDPTNGAMKFLGYYYRTDIFPNTQAIQNAAVGSSVCTVAFPGVTLDADSNYVLLGASISIKSLDPKNPQDDPQPVQSIDTIKQAYNSDEYKQATNILLSTEFNS